MNAVKNKDIYPPRYAPGLSNCRDCVISGVGSNKVRVWDRAEMIECEGVLLCAYHARLRKMS